MEKLAKQLQGEEQQWPLIKKKICIEKYQWIFLELSINNKPQT